MNTAVNIITDAMARFGRLPAYLVYRAVYDNLGNHGRNRRVMRTSYTATNRALTTLAEQGAVRLTHPDGTAARVPDDRPRSRWPPVLADDVLVNAGEGCAEFDGFAYSTTTYAWKVLDDCGGAMSPQQIREGIARLGGRTQNASSVVRTLVDNHAAYSVVIGSRSYTWAMTTGDEDYCLTADFVRGISRPFRTDDE